jgi:hypothetical protein
MPQQKHYDSYSKIGDKTLKRIEEINESLKASEKAIKDFQPVSTGSITLHLYGCGKDCLGCPHVRWYRWFYNRKAKAFQSHSIKNPLRRLKRTGEFEENYDFVKTVIVEVTKLVEERKKLISGLTNLGRLHQNNQ